MNKKIAVIILTLIAVIALTLPGAGVAAGAEKDGTAGAVTGEGAEVTMDIADAAAGSVATADTAGAAADEVREEGFSEKLTRGFTDTLGKYVSKEAVVFIISMIPILELRGGLLAASLLDIDITLAIPLCIIGNIIPIPFILLFIKKLFVLLKKVSFLKRPVEWLENRAMNKSDSIAAGEFVGLMLFVGIPLPGTGAWTGSLIAALLEMDFKKAILAELLGIVIATVIMSLLAYGLLARFV